MDLIQNIDQGWDLVKKRKYSCAAWASKVLSVFWYDFMSWSWVLPWRSYRRNEL